MTTPIPETPPHGSTWLEAVGILRANALACPHCADDKARPDPCTCTCHSDYVRAVTPIDAPDEVDALRSSLGTRTRQLDAAVADWEHASGRWDAYREAAMRLARKFEHARMAQWVRSEVLPGWSMGDFIGPCAHGRDPYERCEDGCDGLSPRDAFAESIRAPLRAERDAALVRAQVAETELAATRAGADHLRASFDRSTLGRQNAERELERVGRALEHERAARQAAETEAEQLRDRLELVRIAVAP
jgi:hypothetical protein